MCLVPFPNALKLDADARSVTISGREPGGGGGGGSGTRELSVSGKATDNEPHLDDLHADIRHHEADGDRNIRHQRRLPGRPV